MTAISRKRRPRIARVLLRLPEPLHRALARAAAEAGVSFNEHCVRRLAEPALPDEGSAVRPLVVGRARDVFGDRLSGVVALGSWVRGDAGAASDIDVLIAIDPGVPLTRDLYRAWDQAPLQFEGRGVDAHFVHPQAAGAPPGALWCEAAVEGVIWHDRDGRLASRLAEVRRAIAVGRVVRAFAHGQPYWKGAA